MDNQLNFYPDLNSYTTTNDYSGQNDSYQTENDYFSPMNSSSMPNNQPTILPSSSSTLKRRKPTTDTETSFSPASIQSENSNYSDSIYPTFSRTSNEMNANLFPMRTGSSFVPNNSLGQPSNEELSTDENEDDDEESSLARKREKHTLVEAQRRALEKAHFRELSSLISSRNDSKSSKLHHLDLLKIAAEQISEMNLRHKHDPLRPSNLTDNELNFLNIEASNSFLFVTTMEPSLYKIIHVTDSIHRVLNLNVEQWHGQNFFSFVHPEDLLRVQSQLMNFNPAIGIRVHIECRLRVNPMDRFCSVVIDGITKKLDQSLRPIQNNAPGYLMFVAICHVPLITKYSEINMALYKDTQSLVFRCRCSPNDWKIFLVDRSVSTVPCSSFENYRQKSILDFIHPNDQNHFHQTLLRASNVSLNEMIRCHFLDSISQHYITMNVEIRSFFNPVVHRADFIELTFKNEQTMPQNEVDPTLLDLINDTKEIERLLESDPPTSINNENPTSLHPSFFYDNSWTVKNELH